jgi:predicted aspartyl protease
VEKNECKVAVKVGAMGEVRVRVKLTNAVDEALVRRGQLAEGQVRIYETEALVDTGAVRCALPPFVADRLGLDRVARYMAQYADGRLEEVDLTEGFVLEIMGRRTTEEALVLGDELLIGQTALEKLDLLPDCQRQRLVPNPAHPDQPVSKVK